MADDKPTVTIYTDGGCDPNPGPGGWGVVLIFVRKDGEQTVHELKGGEPDTTNNRMELTAAIQALRALKQPCIVEFYTDSQYVQKGITEWMQTWERTNFKKGKIQNVDLWQALKAETARHEIRWHWVKGHAGNTHNERADQLAMAAILEVRSAAEGRPVPSITYAYLRTSCKGTPGAGGWAVLLKQGGNETILSGGHPQTNPGRLDLLAAIAALEAVPEGEAVQIFTANGYVHDSATRWIHGWKKYGWKRKEGDDVKYRNLWQRLDQLSQVRHVRWALVNAEARPPEMDSLDEPLRKAVEEASLMEQPPAEPEFERQDDEAAQPTLL